MPRVKLSANTSQDVKRSDEPLKVSHRVILINASALLFIDVRRSKRRNSDNTSNSSDLMFLYLKMKKIMLFLQRS